MRKLLIALVVVMVSLSFGAVAVPAGAIQTHMTGNLLTEYNAWVAGHTSAGVMFPGSYVCDSFVTTAQKSANLLTFANAYDVFIFPKDSTKVWAFRANSNAGGTRWWTMPANTGQSFPYGPGSLYLCPEDTASAGAFYWIAFNAIPRVWTKQDNR